MAAARHDPPTRRINIRVIFVGIVGLLLLWWLCGFIYDHFIESDEDHIRDVLHAAAQGARERRPVDVSAALTEDFVGPNRVTKDIVHEAMVHLLIVQYRAIQVDISPEPIPVTIDPADKKKATALMRAIVRGKVAEQAPWENVAENHGANDTSKFKFLLRKTDRGWRVYQVDVVKEQ
jgi:hypothetical protein